MKLNGIFLLMLVLSTMTEAQVITDFSSDEELRLWRITNDSVMGGRSFSQFDVVDKVGVFSGSVSLQNNGGFASVFRPVFTNKQTADARVVIKIKGDGKWYQLRFRTNRNAYGLAYQVPFKTASSQWQTLEFKLSDFSATYRGYRVNNAPQLSLSLITSVGFLIAKKQVGNFNLQIGSIEVIADENFI